MRGVKVPFAETADVALLPAQGKIPKAFPNNIIDSTWFSLTPPSGALFQFGFINSPLPTLPSNQQGAIGYDPAQDQVQFWTGTSWKMLA
jgi:hypothetical protein